MTNTQRCDGLTSLYDYYRMLYWLTYREPAQHTWPEVQACILMTSKYGWPEGVDFDATVLDLMRQNSEAGG